MRYLCLAATALSALALVSPAEAIAILNPVPSAYYETDTQTSSFGVYTDSGPTITSFSQNVSGSGYTAAQSSTPEAAVSASATNTNVADTVYAHSEMVYFFKVSGPTSLTPVPVSISGVITGLSTPMAVATASLTLTDSQDDYLLVDPGYGAFSDTVDLTPNKIYEIDIYAIAGISYAVGTASASVDPYIFVNPTFAGANQYSIILSSGVGNQPPADPVPEPASLALLATSVIGLGLGKHRRIR